MPLPKPSESGSEFIKLNQGGNRIRIVSLPVEKWKHFDKIKKQSVECAGDGCYHCQSGDRVRHSYFFNAIDVSDQTGRHNAGQDPTAEIKIMEVGSMVYGQYYDLSISDDWTFDEIPDYDLLIIKSGDGMETKYNTQATPKRALSDNDRMAVANAKGIEQRVAKLFGGEVQAAVSAPANAVPMDLDSEIRTEDIPF